ncbi:MAG: DUF6525 family protein [Pseudomonadota bacterium]
MRKNGNLGRTSLKRRRQNEDSMRDYDQLPPELRAWLAQAVLPWRPRSVRRAFDRVMARTQDTAEALAELSRLQDRRLAQDAPAVWGADHPEAEGKARA